MQNTEMIYLLDCIESFHCKFPNRECGGPEERRRGGEERNDGQKSVEIIIIQNCDRGLAGQARPVFLVSLQGFCTSLVWPGLSDSEHQHAPPLLSSPLLDLELELVEPLVPLVSAMLNIIIITIIIIIIHKTDKLV